MECARITWYDDVTIAQYGKLSHTQIPSQRKELWDTHYHRQLKKTHVNVLKILQGLHNMKLNKTQSVSFIQTFVLQQKHRSTFTENLPSRRTPRDLQEPPPLYHQTTSRSYGQSLTLYDTHIHTHDMM